MLIHETLAYETLVACSLREAGRDAFARSSSSSIVLPHWTA
jgi:hypothetical protein